MIEEEQLDAQQEGVVKSNPSDSSDDDYQPIPQMAPRPHDREASGSSSSSTIATTDRPSSSSCT